MRMEAKVLSFEPPVAHNISMTLPTPSALKLKKSFGFGDRLGLATPGHLAAVEKTDFAPIFAQQSVREMERTARTPQEVLGAAQQALAKLGYAQPWGADADHHKTPQDVEKSAAAGFTFFTIDPSAFVNNNADRMLAAELEAEVLRLESDGIFARGWSSGYLGKRFEVAENLTLEFTPQLLGRAAVKYARAIAHSAVMSAAIAKACVGRAFDIEVSVDETDSVTSPLDHLFCGLELRQRGVPVTSLAPRFVGEFEKGIDYRGDFRQFEKQLSEHVAVAKYCGPYKISVHSGSDKFSIYPIVGRVCGEIGRASCRERVLWVTGVQTCALPICPNTSPWRSSAGRTRSASTAARTSFPSIPSSAGSVATCCM